MVIERDQLEAKLGAVKAQIQENKIHKEKLMAVIFNCQQVKQLTPSAKATRFFAKRSKRI